MSVKTIQYIVDMPYTKEQTLKVAGILFSKLLQTVKALKKKGIEYKADEFAIYPVNAFKLLKLKKIVMSGKDRGINLVDALDESFLAALEKENLKVQRSQNEIK